MSSVLQREHRTVSVEITIDHSPIQFSCESVLVISSYDQHYQVQTFEVYTHIRCYTTTSSCSRRDLIAFYFNMYYIVIGNTAGKTAASYTFWYFKHLFHRTRLLASISTEYDSYIKLIFIYKVCWHIISRNAMYRP